MDPSNNVDVSEVTMVDNLDGITGIGAQNSTSKPGTGTGAQLNFLESTDTYHKSNIGYLITSQGGVQGGCTQESIADSLDPGQPSLPHLDSQATIVPTLTGDNQDFTPSKTAATGLLLLVGSTEEVHKTLASSNRGRGALASFLSQGNSTPNSTMPPSRLSNGRLSNRYHLQRNQHHPSTVVAKGSSTSTTTGKRNYCTSSHSPSEPPRKKTRTTSDSTSSSSKPQGTMKTTTKGAGKKGCSTLASKEVSSQKGKNQ